MSSEEWYRSLSRPDPHVICWDLGLKVTSERQKYVTLLHAQTTQCTASLQCYRFRPHSEQHPSGYSILRVDRLRPHSAQHPQGATGSDHTVHSTPTVLQAQATQCTASFRVQPPQYTNILRMLQVHVGHMKSLTLAFFFFFIVDQFWIHRLDIIQNGPLFMFLADKDLDSAPIQTPTICNPACSWCSSAHTPELILTTLSLPLLSKTYLWKGLSGHRNQMAPRTVKDAMLYGEADRQL